MSARRTDIMVKGWCPGLLTPMESGDGLIVRVKPRGGRLKADQVRAIADGARRHGNGLLDITNRGNLQIRGLKAEDVEPFAALVLSMGLAASNPALEQIRNIILPPLGRDDPVALFDTEAAALSLEQMLADTPTLHALPAKFGFLVDAGGILGLGDMETDIAFRVQGGVLMAVAGGHALPVAPDEIADTGCALALAFMALRAECQEPPRRMKALVKERGAAALFAKAGLTDAPFRPQITAQAAPVGALAFPGRDRGCFTLTLPFGQMETGAFAGAAALAEHFGDGTLRLTPWRSLMIVNVAPKKMTELTRLGQELGFITDASDRRLAITTCPGSPACASAAAATRTDAAFLAASDLPLPALLHIAGCAKGCAYPHAAPVTFVGQSNGYDIILDGRADATPRLRGLTIREVGQFLASPTMQKKQ